jgi:hypothetical protein
MRIVPRFWFLIVVVTLVDGKRIVRRPLNDNIQHIVIDERRRYLKKGGDDDGGDYYFGFEKHSGKGNAGNKPSQTPSIRPPATSPITESSPTDQPQENKVPPKKKPDLSKKSKDMNSKKIGMPSREPNAYRGKGKGNSMGKGQGKGKGKGKGGDDDGGGIGSVCMSVEADAISAAIPEVAAINPVSCCYYSGPISVYVTHALLSDDTMSGLEPFWDEIYQEITRTSHDQDVCFVLTGLNSITKGNRSIDQILIDVNVFASEIPTVNSILTTDPTTDNTNLINEIRRISSNTTLPSIGIFNAGYNNIIIESIVSGQERLPFVGLTDDSEYGQMAGSISLELLDGIPAIPLCFNARLGILDFLGERCAAYYSEITSDVIEPEFGVVCGPDSTVEEITVQLNGNATGAINAVWSPLECCSVVAEAVATVRETTGRKMIVGCQDNDPTNGRINFVTAQPIALQGYAAASWANFPTIQAKLGNDGRAAQYFPSLQSLVNTGIYNEVIR